METFFTIAFSFLAGLSLGADMSWTKDNYRSSTDMFWVLSFYVSISMVVIITLTPIK